MLNKQQRDVIGWREWLALPDLGVSAIKAKIDTGARSSAIHAFDVHHFGDEDERMVEFKMHPKQRNSTETVTATAKVLDQREVRNSGGHSEERIVIVTTAQLRGHEWQIELTLTNRDVMGFRMLLGRAAVRERFLVHPGKSYLLSARPKLPFRST
ncbi:MULTISPECIES: ATP-dependent zinc protease family protein [Oscillatoriales]|uniref:Ribosomal protein S6 modification protein like n=4 Tax=Limnospira TaxID=2596745 RepID=A0A9P1KED4_9CYAN|nr:MULTISPECIES: RimK/LysX family protein [Oscillatoriales]AMW30386.1 aspartyl protease [Arthrospira platensis YZ]EKD06144.1 hypothetical protein SPLC1_S540890 [Arthrospira platensis C1]MBD2668113.1 ATP-dependent zinc protease [Arthrospira platensis FACHB-439]MBD2709176.1 ATP-dependent zinc protease [Arthrospira platensis FACHB-835]MDC0839039.1 RimK/LysX family protein [Limnoraphis robusta]MDT9309187.1 RimK/LysX family protein [Limnospira sp. Paracas R14]MDY7054079.1 RimK/LysX family protein